MLRNLLPDVDMLATLAFVAPLVQVEGQPTSSLILSQQGLPVGTRP